MLAGKSQKFANIARKRLMLATLCCLFLVFSLAGFVFSTPADVQPEIVVLGPDVQTYDIDAVQWEFPLTLTSFGPGARTARLVEFSIDGYDLFRLVPEHQRKLTVNRLDNEIGRENFRTWNNYRKRAAILRVRNDEKISFSPTEEREFKEGSSRLREIMLRHSEIEPAVIAFNVPELPFQVAADGHYRVSLVVERGQVRTAWEGEILIVDVEPLATNSVWTPADLHIHSTFADDGRFTPAQLAPMLANRGYQIAYITDEPAGWGITQATFPPRMSGSGDFATNDLMRALHPSRRDLWLPVLATWETYRDAVRSASTIQVALFPGAEISASNVNGTHTGVHRGHALAYGIQNLTGTGAFETTGLRYNWFLPRNLLDNININKSATSSASIAHPVDFQIPLIPGHPWHDWGPSQARYNGFELMAAGQGLTAQGGFGPNSSPMVRWRTELVNHLSGVFIGGRFPSARTGSDWGGLGSEAFEISYFTFIGLPSRPSDMRQLSQASVDQALRAGRTVASRLGGVASLRLRNAQGGLQEVGSWLAVPLNSTVSGDVVLRAARSGNYHVRLVEDDFRRVWTLHNAVLSAGQTITIPVSFVFPGGQRFYHVIVEHSSTAANDTIYTSPIFIRQ